LSSPFPSLQRYNTNPVLSTNKQTYTYKDYQAESAINPNQKIDKFAQPEPLTSLYTFPSLMKPNNNWRKPYSQPSTIEGSSSAWRLFGVHHARRTIFLLISVICKHCRLKFKLFSAVTSFIRKKRNKTFLFSAFFTSEHTHVFTTNSIFEKNKKFYLKMTSKPRRTSIFRTYMNE